MLFIIAWAAIAFAIVRALVVAWGFHRRFAVATAVAVAAAFALGAISPFALPSRTSIVAGAPAPAAPVAPVVDRSHSVVCPPGAALVAKMTSGHLDTVAVGATAVTPTAAQLDVPAGTSIQLGGWIVLDAGPAATICAIVDGHAVAATTRYGITRPDVAAALGKPADAASGFNVTIRLPHGSHTVNIGAVEADGHTVDGMAGGSLKVEVH